MEKIMTKQKQKRVRVPDEQFVTEWCKVTKLTDNDGKRTGTFQLVADGLGLQETSVIQRQYAVNRKLAAAGFERLPKMPGTARKQTNIADLAKLVGLQALAAVDEADAEAEADTEATAEAAK
jgi:hypothetical protein